jgi:NitT/TauT family transport system substrate-binding protein
VRARRVAQCAGALAIAFGLAIGPSSAQTADPILIAGTANDSGGEVFYAKDLGLFEKAGLNVTVQALNNPGATIAGVIGGTLTAGSLTIPGIAAAREKGLPVKILAPSSIYSSAMPTSGIIVLKNSPIKKASDLNGKTVATRDLSNMSYFGAKAWIDKNGGDSKTIKWVEINDTQDVAAMQAGRIDAASVSEPAFDDAIHSPDARLLAACYDAIGDKFTIAAYVVSEAYAKAHPDTVRKLSGVLLAAGIWANKNHAASAKILEKYSGAPVPPGNTRVVYAERIRAADVSPVLDMLLRYGILKAPMRPDDLFAAEAGAGL